MMEVRPIDANALFDALYDNEFQTFCPLDEVSDVIAAAPTLDLAPKWFRVKDEPPPSKFVFVWCALTQSVEIAKYKGTLWRTQESRHALNADWITHWMPLPLPPKEES